MSHPVLANENSLCREFELQKKERNVFSNNEKRTKKLTPNENKTKLYKKQKLNSTKRENNN